MRRSVMRRMVVMIRMERMFLWVGLLWLWLVVRMGVVIVVVIRGDHERVDRFDIGVGCVG